MPNQRNTLINVHATLFNLPNKLMSVLDTLIKL